MNATVPAAAAAPAPVPVAPAVKPGDLIFVQLAREIAMDIQPLEAILKSHEINENRWSEISANPRFLGYLQTAMSEWNSALNTGERVKLKALSMVEEALPEMYARMHDPRELLASKVRAMEVIGKIGGVGVTGLGNTPGSGSEKFSVTINLGADQQLKISADVPKTIDASDQ
jgi:hypothetical protein